MTNLELKEILDKHLKWLRGEEGGERADLRGEDLRDANLCDAKIATELLDYFFPICCPEYGSFVAWKKAGDFIVKLEVTER